MTAPTIDGQFRTVLIGGREYPKPFEPTCPACRSPWLLAIDEMLAEGYTLEAIRRFLAGRRPAPPREAHLREHIAHLAEPHRKMRDAVEAAAAGTEPPSLVGTAAANQAVIQRGFQLLAAGQLEITSRDLLRALALQAQIEKADQGAQLDSGAWQAAFVEFFGLVRKHMTGPQWAQFTADVYASPQIRSILAEPAAIPTGETHG